MMLGQAAATAAVLAQSENKPVQQVRYDQLKEKLLQDGQVIRLSKDIR
jgi:hypothetical protein